MAKDIEEILTKSGLEARACHMVALDGTNWAQVRAIKGDAEEEHLLEEKIQLEQDRISSRKGVLVFEDNSLPGYGVNYANMSCFRGKGANKFHMNYNLLRQIYYGLHHVEIPEQGKGVPPEILSAMNTFEILSLYRAFAKLIENGYVEIGKQKISRDQLKNMPAELAISKMISYGCRHDALYTMRNRGFTGFPTERGDLIKRIVPFTQQTKDRFMTLLDNKMRTTEVTKKDAWYDFHDPCYDAMDARKVPLYIKGYTGTNIYCRAIDSFMKNLHERHTQQKT